MVSKKANIDWKKTSAPSPYTNVSCVYSAYLMDPKAPAKPMNIPRFMGNDTDGIIEIGQTVNLAKKISHFKGALFGTPRSDSGGWNLGYIYERNEWLREIFTTKQDLLEHIHFSYIETKKDLLSTNLRKAIDDHCGRFGEPPVLTNQVPGVKWSAIALEASSEKEQAIDLSQLKMMGLTDKPQGSLERTSCVYWAYMMDASDPSTPVLIKRFGKTDPAGTLAIGQTKDLAQRIRQIRYDIKKPKRKGEWGLFYHLYKICARLRKACGPRERFMERLKIGYIETPHSNLDRGEIRAINKYISLFGELPPFNSQIPGDTRYE